MLSAVVLILAASCCVLHGPDDEGMGPEVCTGMLAPLTAILFVALVANQRVLPELVPVIHRVPIHLLDPPPRSSRS